MVDQVVAEQVVDQQEQVIHHQLLPHKDRMEQQDQDKVVAAAVQVE
jgi:hypothetical protein